MAAGKIFFYLLLLLYFKLFLLLIKVIITHFTALLKVLKRIKKLKSDKVNTYKYKIHILKEQECVYPVAVRMALWHLRESWDHQSQ